MSKFYVRLTIKVSKKLTFYFTEPSIILLIKNYKNVSYIGPGYIFN